MPGLLRGVARTAVIAGTASHVSNNVTRRQNERWAEQGKTAPAYMGGAPQEAAPMQAAPAEDPLEQLEKLGQLKAQGILTDAEFEAQKAKILAG